MKKILKYPQQWQQELDPETYHITREAGTEVPFSVEYNDCKISGTYRCVCSVQSLFSFAAVFDCGCGWLSFSLPLHDEVIEERLDTSHFMVRTEVRCERCEAHLGHVFPDGPAPTVLRYCIDSRSLTLESDAG